MKVNERLLDLSYDEIDRRIDLLIRFGCISSNQISEERFAMLQGLYSVYSVIADNWPQVRSWCDAIEDKRGY